jgi:hypothetical protein
MAFFLFFPSSPPSYYIATFLYISGIEQQAGGHDMIEMVDSDSWLELISMKKRRKKIGNL